MHLAPNLCPNQRKEQSMRMKEGTLVACNWHAIDAPRGPKNALGLIKKQLSRHRREQNAIFEVQLLYPAEVGGELRRIPGENMIAIAEDMELGTIQYCWPEIALNLVKMLQDAKMENDFLLESSGFEFQEAAAL